MGFKSTVVCSNDVKNQELKYELEFDSADEALVYAELTQAAVAEVYAKLGFAGVLASIQGNPGAEKMLEDGKALLKDIGIEV